MRPPPQMRLTDCTVDLDRRVVVRATEVSLTPIETRLLAYLMAHHGRVIPAEELLSEVWGYRKGVKTRTLTTAIARLRAKIEADPRDPDHLHTVHRVGYRFDADTLEAPSSLTGRRAELRAIKAALATHSWVGLVGPGGVGKTTLARVWAQLAGRDVVFVEAASCDDEAALVRAVATALRTTASVGVEAALVARGAVLLVLDNIEQIAPAVARVVPAWIAAAPELGVLSTSRVEAGPEHVLRVEPLSTADATELFVARAGAVTPDALDAARVARVVEKLDNLPLAVELAASRLALLALEALDEGLEAFAERDLRGAVRGSWSLLDDAMKRLLGAVSVFRGAFTVQAAAAVLGEAEEEVFDGLNGLRARSLLRADPGGQLQLYDAVRTFAREHIPVEVPERWARWLADQNDPAWLEDQLHALDRVGARDPRLAARLLARADETLLRLGLAGQARDRLEWLLTLDLTDAEASHAWARLAEVRRLLGQREAARQAIEAGRALEAPDRQSLVRLAVLESAMLQEEARPEAAIAVIEALLASGDLEPRVEVAVRQNRANALRYLGRLDGAAREYEATVRLAARHGLRELEAMVLSNLGGLETERGRLDRGAPLLERSIRLYDELGDGRLAAISRGGLGDLYLQRGDLDRAEAVLRQAAEEAVRFARPLVHAVILMNLGIVAQERGALDQAAAHLTRGLDLVADVDRRYGALARQALGMVHHERGWVLPAREAYGRAVDTLREVGDHHYAAWVAIRRAVLDAPTDPVAALAAIDAESAALRGDPQVDTVVPLYRARIRQVQGEDVSEVVAWARGRDPDTAAPSRVAWSTEARFALRLLTRARPPGA